MSAKKLGLDRRAQYYEIEPRPSKNSQRQKPSAGEEKTGRRAGTGIEVLGMRGDQKL
jgi:hypothetical protein